MIAQNYFVISVFYCEFLTMLLQKPSIITVTFDVFSVDHCNNQAIELFEA
jgi:hypothetical protein